MTIKDIPPARLDIRRGMPADAAELAEFAVRVFVSTFAAQNTPDDLALYVTNSFGEAIQRRELDDPRVTYLLLAVDGALSAFALLRNGATDPVVHGETPIEIERFYVASNFHGRGIAAALMKAAIESAESQGGRTLWLGVWEQNPRAIRFYEKCGFVDIGAHEFHLGRDVQTDRVMSRRIGLPSAPEKVNLSNAFATFTEHWDPRIAGTLNGQQVKLVKFQGEFVWHHHDHEDELFLVHRGRFAMEFRDRTVTLETGDFLIVPRGVEHRPVAEHEVEVLLFEPAGTLNTGNVQNARTVANPASL